ncbi:MAG: restriction endonuclease subunit S [Acidobacteria bacterium]|nr:restriction endonuclease subunit S [Acidobacteriota bacterium]
MKEVIYTSLEDAAERVMVSYVGPTTEYFCDNGVPFLRTANVGEREILLKDLKYIKPDFHVKLKKSILQTNDVIVSRVISDKINCAIVPSKLDGANCGNIIIIRPGRNLIPEYITHYISFPLTQQKLLKLSVGTAQSVVNTSVLKALLIPLPPLPEQQRIAAILDKADALREKRRRAIAKLDELLESSFLQLYENKLLLNTMKLEDVAEKSRGSFVNGPFGSDLLTSELTKSGVPVIYIRDIREGEYNRVSESFVSKDKAEKLSVCSVFPRDVLIAKVGDPPGTAALYPDNEPYGIVTQDVIRIRTNNQIVTPEFLVSYFNSSIGCWNLSKIIIEATRARFSLTDLKKLSLEIPSLSQQKQFSSIAKKIFALKLQQKKSLDKLDILFLSLQQRAFSGELFAQQANDELDKVANEEKPGQMSLFDLMR